MLNDSSMFSPVMYCFSDHFAVIIIVIKLSGIDQCCFRNFDNNSQSNSSDSTALQIKCSAQCLIQLLGMILTFCHNLGGLGYNLEENIRHC